MKFLVLTEVDDGADVLIAAEHITAVRTDRIRGRAIIELADGHDIPVKQSAREVRSALASMGAAVLVVPAP